MPTDEDIEQRLTAERPVPQPAYRGSLRRHLRAIGTPPSRPANLGLLVLALVLAGILLLAVAVLSMAGAGPLAA